MAANFGFTPDERAGSYFISYNSEDADRVAPIVRELHEKGVPVWYDYGLEYGRSWKAQIAKHISSSKAVILFVTKKLLQRKDGSYAQIEYELATDDFGKTVYIVFMDSISSSDVIMENKVWWHEINRLHCVQNANAAKIMNAIGFTSVGNSSSQSISAAELNRTGDDYYYGRNGKPQDYVQAVKYFRLAADHGYAEAQCNLGYSYHYGKGVKQDYTEAVRLYRLAADQGDAAAQCNLGYCYENGQGVKQDYAEAVRLYRLAADQGNAIAQYNLGYSYHYGKGVKQDYAEAVRLFRLAADQGEVYAQYNLGTCYENGHGVPQNRDEAIRLYRLAAKGGSDSAKESLARLGVDF